MRVHEIPALVFRLRRGAGLRRPGVSRRGERRPAAARAAGQSWPLGPVNLRLMADREHVPVRPGWLCAACEQSWPCHTARIRLADEYRREPISVGMYLCAQMHDAIADLDPIRLPGLTPAGFYHRFLAWVRPEGSP